MSVVELVGPKLTKYSSYHDRLMERILVDHLQVNASRETGTLARTEIELHAIGPTRSGLTLTCSDLQ
jgi:hypothetical protein